MNAPVKESLLWLTVWKSRKTRLELMMIGKFLSCWLSNLPELRLSGEQNCLTILTPLGCEMSLVLRSREEEQLSPLEHSLLPGLSSSAFSYLRCRLVIINITRSLCSPLNTMLQVLLLCWRGEDLLKPDLCGSVTLSLHWISVSQCRSDAIKLKCPQNWFTCVILSSRSFS